MIEDEIRHIVTSTQQDGAGLALGQRDLAGKLYVSRIDEHTKRIMLLIDKAVIEGKIEELRSVDHDHVYNTTLTLIGRARLLKRIAELEKQRDNG